MLRSVVAGSRPLVPSRPIRRPLLVWLLMLLAVLIVGFGLPRPAQASPSGAVFGTGYNYYGVLGNGGTGDLYAFAENPYLPGTVVQASPGYYSSLFLLANGTVEAAGYNDYGGLGDGTTEAHHVPEQVSALSNVVEVAAGGDENNYALLSNGTVEAWGYNYYGQLGVGSESTTGCDCREAPTSVVGVGGSGKLEGVVAITAGYEYAAALLKNGKVVTWGYGDDGELGNGEYAEQDSPVEVHGLGNVGMLEGVTQISSAAYNVLALLGNGKVVAWGYGNYGENGNGEYKAQDAPVEVEGVGGSGKLEGVASISGGYDFDLALTQSGEVLGWGENEYYELGNGTDTDSDVPTPVGGGAPLTGVSAITAGAYFGLAEMPDHKVVGWGYAEDGELGNGDAETETPATIPGLSDVIALGHGDYNYQTFAIEGASAKLSFPGLSFVGETGATTASQSVTLTNEGPAPLTISGDSLGGANASSFAISSDTCKGATLAANASCSVAVAFAPVADGNASATLSFSSSALNTLSPLALSGVAVAAPSKEAAKEEPKAVAPAISVLGSALKAANGHLPVKLACTGATCKGKLTLVAKVTSKGSKGHKGKAKTVVLASGSYTLAAGQQQSVSLKLTSNGKQLLAKLSKHKSLKAKLKVTITGGASVTKAVKVS